MAFLSSLLQGISIFTITLGFHGHTITVLICIVGNSRCVCVCVCTCVCDGSHLGNTTHGHRFKSRIFTSTHQFLPHPTKLCLNHHATYNLHQLYLCRGSWKQGWSTQGVKWKDIIRLPKLCIPQQVWNNRKVLTANKNARHSSFNTESIAIIILNPTLAALVEDSVARLWAPITGSRQHFQGWQSTLNRQR